MFRYKNNFKFISFLNVLGETRNFSICSGTDQICVIRDNSYTIEKEFKL